MILSGEILVDFHKVLWTLFWGSIGKYAIVSNIS